MGIRLVVAVTDSDWHDHLRQQTDNSKLNFWAPSAASFRALEPGELFLFKLHSPRNYMVGGGVFAYANAMPCSLAWQAFGKKNGASSYNQMRSRIAKYRKALPSDRADFEICCRILTLPFFLHDSEWIKVPESWAPNIVSFKGYSTDDDEGRLLWDAVQGKISGSADAKGAFTDQEQARFGEPILVKPRLGQGAFRVLVTDSYRRRCAISGERTLPAWVRPISCRLQTAARMRRRTES